MNIEEIQIDKLKPNPWNPNKIDKKTFDHLVKQIKTKGFLQPILVRKKEGYYEIIDGEHRWRASKEAGLTKIPAVVIDVDDNTAKILTINMNRIKGEDDPVKFNELLKDLLNFYDEELLKEELNLSDLDLEAVKIFEGIELDDMRPEKKPKTVICPKCGYEFEV